MTPVKIALIAAGALLALLIGATLVGPFAWDTIRSAGPLPSPGPLPHPVQTEIPEPYELAGTEKFSFKALDEYEVEALVVSRKRYRWDTEAEISPVDLLLVWGDAAANGNPRVVSWSQRGRYGYWNWPRDGSLRLSDGGIGSLAANTHIIPEPGDRAVRKSVLRLRRGDHVLLRGYLVNVYGPNGWKWETSRRRSDKWGGACEVFYVTDVQRLG